jgi:hypothetical protein
MLGAKMFSCFSGFLEFDDFGPVVEVEFALNGLGLLAELNDVGGEVFIAIRMVATDGDFEGGHKG